MAMAPIQVAKNAMLRRLFNDGIQEYNQISRGRKSRKSPNVALALGPKPSHKLKESGLKPENAIGSTISYTGFRNTDDKCGKNAPAIPLCKMPTVTIATTKDPARD